MPDGDRRQRGNSLIREMLVEMEVPLTVCGHRHWDEPLRTANDTTQFLNVDMRVVVLQRDDDSAD